MGGEGARGKDEWYWLNHIFVVDVGKEGGHLHNILHVVIAVGEGAGLDKVQSVMIWEGLNVD